MKLFLRIRNILGVVVAILFLLFTLFPVYWLILTSFKTTLDIVSPTPVFLIDYVELKNYIDPFSGMVGPYLESLRNSLIIAVGSIIINLSLGFLAAYGFSRFKLKGDVHLFFWTLTNRMAPPAIFVIPYYMIYSYLHLLDTHVGLIIVYTVFNLPLTIWLLKGFFDSIPKDLEEAALVDGHSQWYVLTKIIIPLSKAGIAVAALFIFIFSWNEYCFAMMLTSLNARTLPSSLSGFVTSVWMQWGYLAAVATVSIIPGLILTFLLSRYILSGMTLGLAR